MAEQRRTRSRSSSTSTARRPASRQASGRGPLHAARSACQGLEGLIGHPSEGVSAVRPNEDGWCVVVDVLEVPRIPDTTSLLASYEVLLDEDGELQEYRRVRRYRRGSADE
ncbi:gas vesicle protein GvpO [Streptomyces hypolithicus]